MCVMWPGSIRKEAVFRTPKKVLWGCRGKQADSLSGAYPFHTKLSTRKAKQNTSERGSQVVSLVAQMVKNLSVIWETLV